MIRKSGVIRVIRTPFPRTAVVGVGVGDPPERRRCGVAEQYDRRVEGSRLIHSRL